MKKEITGQTIGGDERKYVFELLDTETGLEVFYNSVSKLVANDAVVAAFFGDLEVSLIDMARIVPAIFAWDDIKSMAGKMLSGAKITLDDGTINDCGENGFADYMTGDPMELFTALIYAARANFPKHIDPLFEAVKSDDSTPEESESSELQKTAKPQK